MMARHLSQCETLELVAPAGEVGARAERSLLRWCGVLGIPLGRVDPHRGEARNPRVVVGTFDDPLIASLLEPTGVVLGDGESFSWVDREFKGEGLALVATFEDPERRGLPLTVLCGSTLSALDSLSLDLRPVARPGARVFRGGRLTLSLELGAQGAPNEESIIDFGETKTYTSILKAFERITSLGEVKFLKEVHTLKKLNIFMADENIKPAW